MEKNMNDIYNQIDELFNDIKKSEVYKNYVLCSKKMKDNKEIMNLINDIKRLQKIDANNSDDYIKIEIDNKYKLLNSYPIYQSYLIYKEELNELLSEISLIFNDYFSNVLNLDL